MTSRLRWYLTIVLLGPLLGTLIHEATHLVMIALTRSTLHSIVVLGTHQLWPRFETVDNIGAGFMLELTFEDDFSKGVVHASAALVTFALSLAATALYLWRPARVLLIFMGYSLDLVTYVVLPPLGLRRWVFFGAPYSETLNGLALLGVSRAQATGLVLICVALMGVLVLRRRKRPRKRPRPVTGA